MCAWQLAKHFQLLISSSQAQELPLPHPTKSMPFLLPQMVEIVESHNAVCYPQQP